MKKIINKGTTKNRGIRVHSLGTATPSLNSLKNSELGMGKIVFYLLVALSLSVACDDKPNSQYNPPDWLIGDWANSALRQTISVTKEKFCTTVGSCLSKGDIEKDSSFDQESSNTKYKFIAGKTYLTFTKESKTTLYLASSKGGIKVLFTKK